MILSRQNFRTAAAWLLLIAPLLNMPLAFLRLTGKPVPLYGLVQLADFPVLTLLAAGIILLFPEQLKGLWRNKNLHLLFAAAGIYILNTLFAFFVSKQNLSGTLAALFWIAYPVAAAALAPELRRIVPYFAGGSAILLIYSGIVSEKFTGLAGNWNWLQGLIIAFLPAIALWGKREKNLLPGVTLITTEHPQRNRAIILLLTFFIAMGIFFPAGLSRGALAAATAAGIFFFFRSRIKNKIFFRILLIGTATAVIGFFAFLFFGTLSETRFIIWQGALKLFIDQIAACGTGHGYFSEFIRPYLDENYFFSAFAAPHIDHAHNDLLNISCEHGIAGLFFYLTAVITILARREKSSAGIFILWIFLILLICGSFDQHNFTVLCGGFTAVSAGMIIAFRRQPEYQPSKFAVIHRIAGALFIFAAIIAAVINCQTGTLIRQGDLLLINGDIPGAEEKYTESLNKKPTIHALYQLAEINLVRNNPGNTMQIIRRMKDEFGISNYRHTQRLYSVAALQTGDLAGSASAMSQELKNAPFSVINARFYRIILRHINASPESVNAADKHFSTLCQMRNIAPQNAVTFHPNQDDAPFPQTGNSDETLQGNALRETICAFILVLALFGLGKIIFHFCGINGDLAALPLGMVVCGAATLILPPEILKYVILILSLPGIYFFLPVLKKHWKIILITALLFLPLLAAVLLPPSAWDEQVYQISLLRKYLYSSSVMPRPDNPYSAYPSLGQLWLLPGFAFGGLNLPLLCVWLITGIMAAIFFHYASQKSGKLCALAVLAAIFLSPLTWNIIRSFYVETFIAFFTLTGALLLLKDDLSRRHIFAAGLMAGAAAAVKLTGISAALALFILLIGCGRNRKQWWIFIAGAFIAALPFFLRVWIACGNPFYPYFSSLAGASESAVIVESFHRTLGGNYGINPFLGIFFNWILCAYDSINYDGIVTGFQFSLMLLIIITAAVLKRKEDKTLLIFSAAIAGAWIFWNLTAQQTRFLYPLLWFAALALIHTPKSPLMRKLLCAAVLLVSIPAAVNHWDEFKHFILAWKNVSEARKNPAHFAAWIHNEPAYAELTDQLKPLAQYKIASLWERRTLYMPENVTVIMPGFQEKLTPVPESADALYAELKDFDFLIVRPPATDVDKAIEFVPEAVKINEFLLELLKRGKLAIHSHTSDGQLSILRIVPETAPISVRSSN